MGFRGGRERREVSRSSGIWSGGIEIGEAVWDCEKVDGGPGLGSI